MLTQRLTRAIGTPVVRVTPFTGGGYTPARRMIVELSDGTAVFAKQGVNEYTAGAIRREHTNYRRLRGSFLPRLVGWDDDGDVGPILVLEDLSRAVWPPPWSVDRVRRVLDTITEIAEQPVPDGLAALEFDGVGGGWREVAEDPEPFLSLGMCTSAWLDRALPVLLAAAESAPLKGDRVIHFDVRSDNLCFDGDRTLFVDWNHACLANPEVDRTFLMPSMVSEGGPQPEQVGTFQPEMVAVVAGFFACRAGLPPVPGGPGVRGVQRTQLEAALPWATRVLGLPSLGA
ncbi:phosphotransferase family protein [Kutzneria sp. CA-103260]|uniref:phosphotransferase family protein n=1 Tax=Kutzneria sp. CA-103260 TaxID=2802641 RepID=UPI001BAACC9B|nr:phosphotransferase [Kutzneria sp. CA-103260]QUQ66392.1 Phosphotransferase enzyme family protein [Kutzneria sp. CA-103260]